MGAFENHFDKYAEYCDEAALDFPCELFRYDETTTEQEIVGTLQAVVDHVIGNCVSGFGWQWSTTVQALAAAVGGTIPEIVIPDVTGNIF